MRNKTSWGLRYQQEHFAAAWKIIYADKPQPLDVHIKHTFRVEPLPFGCTSDMLVAWSKVLAWDLKPIKAVGPRAWLIGSATLPPPGVHAFNSNPVIIKMIQPKGSVERHPVLAGPKPSRDLHQMKANAEDPFYDPWAPYLRITPEDSASGTQSRSMTGPTESKFAEQDARMTQIEQCMKQMKAETEQLSKETQQGFAQIQQREQQTQHAMTQMRTDLERSFQAALSQQSNHLSSTMEDIKQDIKQMLLQGNRPKRTKANAERAEDAEMSED